MGKDIRIHVLSNLLCFGRMKHSLWLLGLILHSRCWVPSSAQLPEHRAAVPEGFTLRGASLRAAPGAPRRRGTSPPPTPSVPTRPPSRRRRRGRVPVPPFPGSSPRGRAAPGRFLKARSRVPCPGGSRGYRRPAPRSAAGLCRRYRVGVRGAEAPSFWKLQRRRCEDPARSGLTSGGFGRNGGGAARGWALLAGSGCFGCRKLTRRFAKVNATSCPVSKERVCRLLNVRRVGGKGGVSTSLHLKNPTKPPYPCGWLKYPKPTN